MTIKKELIAKEDINFGTDTFNRKSSAGTDISVTKLNASHVPIIDSASKFTSTTVDGALSECQLEDATGSNVKYLTNNSGAQRTKGEVVVVDINNDDSFTTTTTLGDLKTIGVVAETIANGATGKVITGGYTDNISVDALTARGSYLKTSTTEGKSTPTTTFETGVYAFAFSSSAGPGTVTGLVFGALGGGYLPLIGGTLTGMLTIAKGADVTSANALTLGSDGNYFDVTGTTTINTINTVGVGTMITLHFDASLTLTHHATNLILPGAVNLVTGAGDELTFVEYTTGGWRCIGYIDASTTGTGDMVRATTPTLITPQVDTINESTPTSGVTVDGLNIKDSKLNTNNSVVTANITNSAVTTAKLNNQAVTGAKISKVYSGGSQSIANSASWTPVAGVYNMVVDYTSGSADTSYIYVQMYVSGAWRQGLNGYGTNLQTFGSGVLICDGSNVKLKNNANVGEPAATVYYLTI